MFKLPADTASRLTRPTHIKIALATLLLLLAQPAGIRSTGASPFDAQGVKGKARPVSGGRLAAGEKLASANITLLPAGFLPEEVTVPAGPILLSFKKRVGPQSVSLELRPEGRSEVIWGASLPEDALKLSEVIRLHPGTYNLSVAGTPEWVCRVNVIAGGQTR